MSDRRPTVHVLVGLPGAGKTTTARRISAHAPAVHFSLDEWMLRLHRLAYDDEQYVERLSSCRDLMLDLAAQVLSAGVDVTLDWNHFSREKRAASAAWAAEHEADYVVHHVMTPVEVARDRLAQRNRRGEAESHVIDPASVDHALTYLVPPTNEEGHRLCLHRGDEL